MQHPLGSVKLFPLPGPFQSTDSLSAAGYRSWELTTHRGDYVERQTSCEWRGGGSWRVREESLRVLLPSPPNIALGTTACCFPGGNTIRSPGNWGLQTKTNRALLVIGDEEREKLPVTPST